MNMRVEAVSAFFKKYGVYILGIFVFLFCLKKAFTDGDFKVFLEAAKLVALGENPYNEWIFVNENSSCLYFYSPLWAMILVPFSYLPAFIPNMIWLLANVFFLYRIWNLMVSYIPKQNFIQKHKKWVLILTILMSIRFLLYNFDMIQMTIFLLWGVLESIKYFGEGKVVVGAALLAFVINVKIMPVVIIPYLIYRGEYKGSLLTLFFTGVYLFVPAVFVGWSTNSFLLAEWWSVVNPTNSEHLIEADFGCHGLTALIPSLLIDTKGGLDVKRNFINLDLDTVVLITNVIRLLLIALFLCVLKWPPFTKAKSKLNELHELSYILLLIPLIFPHQQKYAFFLLVPAIFYLGYYLVSNYEVRKEANIKKKWLLIATFFGLAFTLMTLSTDGVIGRGLNNYTQHFKTITYGSLFLLVSLLILPSKLLAKKE